MLSYLDYDDNALEKLTSLHADLHAAVDPRLREQAVDALHAKSQLLKALNRKDDALAALVGILHAHSDDGYPGIRHTLALARFDLALWWNEGFLGTAPNGDYPDDERHAQVIRACDALIASHRDSGDPAVVVIVNRALRLKADTLRERGEDGVSGSEQADAVTDAQWARYAGHPDTQVQREVMMAMLGKLRASEYPAEALVGYQAILDRFGDSSSESLRPGVAQAMREKARALSMLDRPDQALEILAALDAREASSADPAVHLQLVLGGTARARILRQAKRVDEALAVLQRLHAFGTTSTEGEKGSSERLRDAVARAMDLQADIWADQAPDKHPHQDGKDDKRARVTVSVTEAERQYGLAVEALSARFATDADADIRELVANAWYGLAVHQRERLHFDMAVETYDRYLTLFAADTLPAIEEVTASAYLNKAYALLKLLDRPTESLAVYDAILARFANANTPDMRDTLSKAAASRLTCLNELRSRGVEISYGAQYEDLPVERRDAIQATVKRAREHSDAGRYREAISVYDEVLAPNGESLHPELRRICCDAMVRKGYCLARLLQREAALVVNDELIARYGNDLSMEIEEDVALAMSNRAGQLDYLGRYDEAIQTHDQIIARWGESTVAGLRRRVASAMVEKALTLSKTGQLEAEQKLCQRVIDIYLHDTDVKLRLQAARASLNLAFELHKSGQHERSAAVGEALLQAFANERDTEIGERLVKTRIALANTYRTLGQPERAHELYRVLLALPNSALTAKQRASVTADSAALRPITSRSKVRDTIVGWFGVRT